MAIKDMRKTVVLQFPEWAGNDAEDESQWSTWEIRAEKADIDNQMIADMTIIQKASRPSDDEVRQKRRLGMSYEDIAREYVTQDTVMSVKHATLQHMSKGWKGPEFVVPEGHVIVDSKTNTATDDPYAGKLPPCTAAYIGMQDPLLIDDVWRLMIDLWEGRDVDQQKLFRGRATGVDDARKRRLSVQPLEAVAEPSGATEGAA